MSEKSSGKIMVPAWSVTLIVLLLIQIIGLAFSYGLLNQQVQFNRQLIQENQINQKSIMNSLHELQVRITRLETILATHTDDNQEP